MTTELPKQPIGAFDYETTISFGDFIASLVEIIKTYKEDGSPIVQDLERLVHDNIGCMRSCDGQCPFGKECEL